ncbi:hypothetical protein DL93DRAFT_1103929 [Clavulina sp. PMI_390]|nr:hypothetical protein DL93DRAFT_1103929 [Clavulina sp. PMI_390]
MALPPPAQLLPNWIPLAKTHSLSKFCHKFWGQQIHSGDVIEFNTETSDTMGKAEYPDTMYIRPCYRDLMTFIETDVIQSPKPNRGIVVRGQPGIGLPISNICTYSNHSIVRSTLGKTFFDWYLIQHRCTQRQPILQNFFNNYYLFFEHYAYKPKFGADDDDLLSDIVEIVQPQFPMWCIIDMMSGTQPPSHFALKPSWYPIQTTTPDPAQYSRWSTQHNAIPYYLPPWSHDELITACVHYNRYLGLTANSCPEGSRYNQATISVWRMSAISASTLYQGLIKRSSYLARLLELYTTTSWHQMMRQSVKRRSLRFPLPRIVPAHAPCSRHGFYVWQGVPTPVPEQVPCRAYPA